MLKVFMTVVRKLAMKWMRKRAAASALHGAVVEVESWSAGQNDSGVVEEQASSLLLNHNR
ncbi:hypothetical protein [Noviherbaspirillum saxi]|uniref:hypothetical protein n=1 Tax=Noviherbaspirillum saxi TaxID=2320863 RepID=UPI0011C47A4D|nr:hypothetical protein [Noviherbaspirillum saxi]